MLQTFSRLRLRLLLLLRRLQLRLWLWLTAMLGWEAVHVVQTLGRSSCGHGCYVPARRHDWASCLLWLLWRVVVLKVLLLLVLLLVRRMWRIVSLRVLHRRGLRAVRVPLCVVLLPLLMLLPVLAQLLRLPIRWRTSVRCRA